MKILFAVETNAGLDSVMDSRFGRAGYFLVYDTDEKKVLSVEENRFKNEAHGVGIKIASFVIESGCRVAIGAQPGPKAAVILEQAQVKMIVNDKGTVKEALERYKEELTV